MKKLLFAATLLSVLSAEVLKVATAPNYPPYEYLENGKLVGFDVDVMQEIANRLNVELEYKYMDFDGLIMSLKSNKVDIVSALMKKTPLREKSLDFTIAFKKSHNYFVVKDETKNSDFGGKDCDKVDLSNFKLGAETGSVQYDIAKTKSSKINGYQDASIAVMALNANKVDAIVLEKNTANIFMQKNPNLSLLCVQDDDTEEGFTVNKGNKKLLDRVNAALKDMIEDGTIEKISQKYGI